MVQNLDSQQKQKTNALADMEWAYKYASKTLVLDQGLIAVDSVGLEPEELATYVLCSSWTRRLWTLQEGRSRSNTFHQFRDCAANFFNLFTKIKKGFPKFSSWIHNSNLPEGDPVREKQQLSMAMMQKGTGDAVLQQRLEVIRYLDPLAYDALTPIRASMFGFIMTTMNMGLDILDGLIERTAKTPQYIQAMYYRDLTEHADEPNAATVCSLAS